MTKKLQLEPSPTSRVLVLTQTDADGAALCALLKQADLACYTCCDPEGLRSRLGIGAGTAIIMETALFADIFPFLLDWVSNQPPWSDFPVIVLTTRKGVPSKDFADIKAIAKRDTTGATGSGNNTRKRGDIRTPCTSPAVRASQIYVAA